MNPFPTGLRLPIAVVGVYNVVVRITADYSAILIDYTIGIITTGKKGAIQMYKEINQRMTDFEARAKYPDSYLLMRMDDYESDMGTLLYVGDKKDELRELYRGLENQMHCGVFEGSNIDCNCIGGVVTTHA